MSLFTQVLATVLGRPTPVPLQPEMDEGVLLPLDRLPVPDDRSRSRVCRMRSHACTCPSPFPPLARCLGS